MNEIYKGRGFRLHRWAKRCGAILCIAVITALGAQQTLAAEALLLAANGASDFQIVVGAEASPSERRAAAELQQTLEAISGATLPVVDDRGAVAAHEILVGNSAHVKQLGFAIDWAALGDEGFAMKTAGGHLLLAGGPRRGTLYAVYTFLEDVLDCRWFTPEVSRIPASERIELPALDRTEIPRLEYRTLSWPPASNPAWAAHNRLNAGAALDAELGGTLTAVGGGHSVFALLPPDEFFATHPEYYSEIGGLRMREKSQLCFTNPEVARIAAERLAAWLRKTPEATMAWVGQMDWGGWCECANCRPLFEREGSQAGVLVDFVNRVAEHIEPEFPRVNVLTFAYQDTRKPPKALKPRHNVTVMVCPIECCYSHPLVDCEVNRSFVKDLQGWASLTEKLYLFDYTGNFDHYVMPHPNLRVLQPNFHFFLENHVKGIYVLGNGGTGSELGDLRGYLLARLMWNPDADVAALLHEFLDAVYGKAAPALARYIALMHDKVEQDRIHCGISSSPMMPHLSPEMIAKAKALFDEAESLADNEAIRTRVQVARLPIQHVELEWLKPRYRVDGDVYRPDPTDGAMVLAKEFVAVAERNGVTTLSEGVPPSWHVERLELWSAPWPAVRLENDVLRVDVVPGLGGRIVSLFHKGAQRELLLEAQADGREYPRSAGYEEYSERGWRSHGCKEEYAFRVERPGKRLALWAELPNGLKLHRTLELEEAGGALAIESHLTNVSAEAKQGCLGIHPMFNLGPTEGVQVSYRDVAGAEHHVTLKTSPGQLRGQLPLEGDQRPAGEWQGACAALGLTIRQSFDLDEVDRCLLDWLPSRQRFNLELASPEKMLAPGESIRLGHRYQFVAEDATR